MPCRQLVIHRARSLAAVKRCISSVPVASAVAVAIAVFHPKPELVKGGRIRYNKVLGTCSHGAWLAERWLLFDRLRAGCLA